MSMKHFTSKILLVALFALIGLSVSATPIQPTTLIKVGVIANGSDYSTIQAAYNTGVPADITSAGAYVIELQSDYDPTGETYPITLGAKTGASATNSITIKPATGVTKTLGCPNQTVTLAGCVINSATSITVPSSAGLSVGMYISNIKYTTAITGISGTTLTVATQTTTSGTYDMVAGPSTGTITIYLNGAQYVTIDGVARTGATQLIIDNPNRIASQSILFKNDASNNTIKNCTVKGVSQTSISAVTGGVSDNGTIYIYNTSSTTADKGNDNNVIDNCDIVDGATIPVTHVCFSGSTTATNDGNKITNCNIDNACLTVAGSTSPGYVIVSANSNNTEISNNHLYASKQLNPSGTQAYNIIITNGTGTLVSSNVIGYSSKDATGLYTIPTSAPAGATMSAIYVKGTATIQNNTIGGFDVFVMGFSAIWTPSTAATGTVVSGNTIKDVKSNTNNIALALAGIYSQTTSASITFTNNTIYNLTNVNTTLANVALTKGFYYSATPTVASTFSGNKIYNLVSGGVTSTGINQAFGIDVNKFYGVIEKNLIYNINAINDNSSIAVVNGIKTTGGNTTTGLAIKNNVVRLGTDVTTKASIYGILQTATTASTDIYNIYHNSVYVGGTSPNASTVSSYAYNRTTTGNVGVIDLRNNIFSNQRTIGGTENHYAIAVLASTDLTNCNYNIYQYRGQLGNVASTNKADLTAWKGSVGTNSDQGSYSSDPQFVAPTATIPDLTISASVYSDADEKGTNVSVTDDYAGATRSSLSPTDIGAYAFTQAIAPTVTIFSSKGQTTAANPIPIMIGFNKNVTGFDITDLTVTNGTAGNFVALSGSVYSADITPTSLGLVTVDIAAGAAISATSTGNAVATQFTRTYSDQTTDLSSTKTNVFVCTTTNGIQIVGAMGQNSSIYSLGGQCVKRSLLTSDNEYVSLVPGFYVVSLNDKRIKISVK